MNMRPTFRDEPADKPLHQRFEALGSSVMRYGLVLVLLWIGGMKFTEYEANGIQAFIANSPGFSWMNAVLGVRGASSLIGIAELVIALLVAVGPIVPRAGAVGGVLASGMFLSTLSFLVSTPGVIEPSLGFPAISVVPGQFLIKDVVLLGVSVWCAGDSWRRLHVASDRMDCWIGANDPGVAE